MLLGQINLYTDIPLLMLALLLLRTELLLSLCAPMITRGLNAPSMEMRAALSEHTSTLQNWRALRRANLQIWEGSLQIHNLLESRLVGKFRHRLQPPGLLPRDSHDDPGCALCPKITLCTILYHTRCRDWSRETGRISRSHALFEGL